MLKLRDGRLHVFLQPKSKNYFWRTFLNGKYLTHTTKTENLALAKSIAENGYDNLRLSYFTQEGKLGHSWEVLEASLLKSLQIDESRQSRLRTYKVKLTILRKFFGTRVIEGIRTKDIEDYIVWRKNSFKPLRVNFHQGQVTPKTLSADLLVLRQVLKYALREEYIQKLPEFPKLSVKSKAGGWFSLEEWKHIQKVGREWINEATSDDQQTQREYTYDYSMFLVHTGMRVDETLYVRYQDIAPDKDDAEICYITVRGGKLSYLMKPSECIGLSGATSAIKRRREAQPDHKPSDLLFPINPRERVHELLVKAGLDRDERDERRTAKNFRHTFIMLRLLQGVDVYKLAKNCRTSVKMIESHYGSYINARMSRDELKKFRTEPSKKGKEQ